MAFKRLDDVTLAREQYKRYEYARDLGHLRFLEKAQKCADYFDGQQWEENVRAQLKAQGKPILTINKIFATLITILGQQVEQNSDVSFEPTSGGSDAVAGALSQVWVQIAQNNKLSWLQSEVAMDGFISSRGYYDVRMDFDDQLKGEVKITKIPYKNVMPDPDANSYDPDEWADVIVTKWMTPDEIEILYGKDFAEIFRSRGSSGSYLYDSIDYRRDSFGSNTTISQTTNLVRVLERQYRKIDLALHFVDPTTGDTRVVPSDWGRAQIARVAQAAGVKVIKRKLRRIRWTVSADDQILHDDWSPYTHFTVVPFFPVFFNGRTIGLVENLLSIQEQLNKAESQELHVINTTANSGWKLKAGSLQNMDADELEQRGGQTGLVMELQDVSDAEKINPNQIPTGLDRVATKSDNHIKELSGQGDSIRGLDRADVAAKAIMAKQAAATINLAVPLANLSRTQHMLAGRVLNLVQDYYSEERLIKIVGDGISKPSQEVTVNQVTPEGEIVNDLTLGEYSVVVTTVPARDTYRQTQFEQAMALRKEGIKIPDDELVKLSNIGQKTAILQAMSGPPNPAVQIELQAKELENSQTAANIKLAEAQAALAAANAHKIAQATIEAAGAGNQNPQAGEEAIKRQAMISDIAIQREKAMADIELKKEMAHLQRAKEAG